MGIEIAKKLAELAQFNHEELSSLWTELYGRAAKLPSRLDFVCVLLAYRLQENTYGGLSSATRKRLHTLAAAIEADPDGEFLDTPRIKPGARLIREWHGETHKVTVVEDGFVYGERRYKSLSEIARLIAGTRWSGPLFFGLKKVAKKKNGNHAT